MSHLVGLPHMCPDCGLCWCACPDCKSSLKQACWCWDCPCEDGEHWHDNCLTWQQLMEAHREEFG